MPQQTNQNGRVREIPGVGNVNQQIDRPPTDVTPVDTKLPPATPEKTPLEVTQSTPKPSPKVSATPTETPSPVAQATVSPLPTRTVLPSPTVALVQQTPKISAPPTDYITPVLAISAIIVGLVMASFLAKKLFDRRKYGRNSIKNLRGLKKAVNVKNELTEKWLKKRKSANIHAIGVGKIDGTDDYCIQVFVEDANGDMLEDPPTQLLLAEFRNLPIVIYEMPRADFLSFRVDLTDASSADEARKPHQILKGGISAANANLSSESGTIGYFFRPNFIDSAAHIFLKKHIYLLSNSHVFADLGKAEKDDSDLIMQPSPGEPAASSPVAELYDYAPINFTGDVENPNFIDAAIAKLHRGQTHSAEIPQIGKIEGFLKKEQVELRIDCQKFGRTTGYTRGNIFSIHLSIWVKYSARGAEAFFKDQFLIVPTAGTSFVKPGDSGSLVADFANNAIGLIFAGAGAKTALEFKDVQLAIDIENIPKTERIENFGVANSISDVMNNFRIKLDV